MKRITLTFEIDKLDHLENEVIEHLFQYGFFTTGIHGSLKSSPFWNGEYVDNQVLIFPDVGVEDIEIND